MSNLKDSQAALGNGSVDVSFIPHTDFEVLRDILNEGVDLVKKKDAEYGASWCKRGGVGAFFTIWRKIDRLEEQLKRVQYNILDISVDEDSTESLDETIRDTILYLALALEKRKAFRQLRLNSNTENFRPGQANQALEQTDKSAGE